MEPWKTALTVLGGVVGGVALLWPVGIWYEVECKCEQPKYEVLRPLGQPRRGWLGGSAHTAELRRYAPMLIAEVAVSGTMRQAGSSGFRAIAGFIFGKNEAVVPAGEGGGSEKIAMTSPVRMEMVGSSEKIAMTSPVRMEMQGSSQDDEESGPARMAFVMPSKYSKATLPRPTNSEVNIRELPAHTAAALKFRGHIRSRKVVEAKKAELLAVLEAEGLVPVGDVQLLQYYPPFTWGWQRRNEVVFQVRERDAKSK